MNRLLYLVVLSLILAVLMTAQAFAGVVTVLAGVSGFSKAGDGIWYQEPFPYTLNLRSPSLGLRYQLDQWSLNLSWWRTNASGDAFPPVYNANTYNLSLGYTF